MTIRSREDALDKKTIIAQLARSAHGDLSEYLEIGRRAALEDPDFFAHLVAWNHVRGEVRDAKVALPLVALAVASGHGDHTLVNDSHQYMDNALAHLADLRPRELAKALLPHRTIKVEKREKGKPVPKGEVVDTPPFAITAGAPRRVVRRLVTRYLRDLEADRRAFERTAVQHRATLHELYSHFHVSRPAWVGAILFHGEKGGPKELAPGVFNVIARLSRASAEEAAGLIVQHKIPFLIARGALGAKAKDPDQVLALIKAMSPTELVTNMKWLESVGVKTVPALRAALEEALGKAAITKTPKATLKTSRAAQALVDDEKLAGKLHALQEKQLEKLGGIDGDWLVLGDKSGSMQSTIETAKQVASVLTRMVKGRVHLVFFDVVPRYVEATGKTLEELTAITRGITAGGGTSIGCGLQYMLDQKIAVDGIAIVSDAGENQAPYFGNVYTKYCSAIGQDPTVYLYWVQGESDHAFGSYCQRNDVDVQRFDLRGQVVDYHSLPNLVRTMRVSRYQLLDEVLATPLRTLDEVLDRTKGMQVLPRALEVTA